MRPAAKSTDTRKYFRHCFCIRKAALLTLLKVFFISGLQSQPSEFTRTVSCEEASAILSEYIRYPSVTGNEKPAGQYIEGICREKGLHVRVFTDSTDSYNFAASLYPLAMNKPNIIFLNHIDVVQEGDDSGWVHPPFSGTITGDTVWGRGAADMKGAAVMQLMAIASFAGDAAESDFPVNATLLCVSGEEKYGKTGAGIISSSFLGELNPAVVFGEGGIGARNLIKRAPGKPVFAISLSDKRALWLKLRLINKTSGHGSIPPPEYANKIMINALHSLVNSRTRIRFSSPVRTMFRNYGKLEKGITRLVLGKPGLFKPVIAGVVKKDPLLLSSVTNTITITRFRGQENEVNQIPQEVEVMLDCRLLPETPTDEFINLLGRKLKNNDIEISVLIETQNAAPTVPDKYYDMFCESLDEAYPGSGILPVLFPATTDNNYFRSAGIPVYGIIPAIFSEEEMKSIHNFNERISVGALEKGTEVYMRFLGKLLR
ncbi:MAG TPA: M20/M25/M40 family metallo-hydrolase [Bacteroidales bacterium]|nr:M20/M25/M40 family metallo-hydrolase [Bacteroidales bacterium]